MRTALSALSYLVFRKYGQNDGIKILPKIVASQKKHNLYLFKIFEISLTEVIPINYCTYQLIQS